MSFAFVPSLNRLSQDRGLFTEPEYRAMRAFFSARPNLAATPLHRLNSLGFSLNIGALDAKVETARFGLNAFKLLGARFALEQLVAEGAIGPGSTVVCASEGNHGRAVAHAARAAGCAARVYVAHDVSASRANAIAAEGADVVRVEGSYDDAVRISTEEAQVNNWAVVSDTSWDGYERIPRLIMLGYTRMMDEVAAELSEPPGLVFVQGGVGGLLCAVASWCAFLWGDRLPAIVSVEPLDAACLLASARAGRPVAVEGRLTTTMAGLRNREVSPLAFAALLPIVNSYLAIDDSWAHKAIRRLAEAQGSDPRIEAGASGAAALGGLLAVLDDPALAAARQHLQLSTKSRVLVIVSEGVTDPDVWAAAMGQS
ncbi:MAG: diaminopropionate ammonia-lyase [Vicinamibacterales bacterium]